MPVLNDTVAGSILGPNGEPAYLPAEVLSLDDAKMLRAFDKFCQTRGLRVAFYCNGCFDGNLADGMRGGIDSHNIGLQCRHRQIVYLGSTY
jgi:hypothetical protein